MNKLKHWILEKIALESLERTGNIPKGTSKAALAYTLFMVTPDPIKHALWTGSQRVVGRTLAVIDSPRGFKPGTHQPSGRNLYADTSTGRYRPPTMPGSRPATVNYRVPRIGGGIMALPALNIGLGVMIAGQFMDWYDPYDPIADSM